MIHLSHDVKHRLPWNLFDKISLVSHDNQPCTAKDPTQPAAHRELYKDEVSDYDSPKVIWYAILRYDMPGNLINGREWRWDAKSVHHTGEAASHSSLLSPSNTIPMAGPNKQDVPYRHYKRITSHKTNAINNTILQLQERPTFSGTTHKE